MKLQKFILFTVSLLALLTSTFGWACKFCPPDVGPTFLKQVDSAKAAVLAELVQRPDPSAKEPTSRYRIVDVLKGSSVKSGDVFEIPLDVQSPVGSVHLFVSDETEGDWKNPYGVSSRAQDFLKLAAGLPVIQDDSSLDDRVQRLEFMLPFLASTDQQIAQSAHGEFSAAPYVVVKELKLKLDHRQLVLWIESEKTTIQNRRLLFRLLGVCGNQYDYFVASNALEERLQNGETIDLDAIVATYLTLGGTKAIDRIDLKLLAGDMPLSVKRAAVAALRFHAEQETIIEKQRIVQSCRLLLKDPKTADFVIADLAQWQDWESLDEILELWKTKNENRWLKHPILEYLKACPRPKARHALQLASVASMN